MDPGRGFETLRFTAFTGGAQMRYLKLDNWLPLLARPALRDDCNLCRRLYICTIHALYFVLNEVCIYFWYSHFGQKPRATRTKEYIPIPRHSWNFYDKHTHHLSQQSNNSQCLMLVLLKSREHVSALSSTARNRLIFESIPKIVLANLPHVRSIL